MAVAAMFDARQHQFSENYISEVKMDGGVRWATSVPVPSFGYQEEYKLLAWSVCDTG